MSKTSLFYLGVGLALLVTCVPRALSQALTATSATMTCSTYSITFTTTDLVPGDKYEIDSVIFASPGQPAGFPVTAGSETFVASSSTSTPASPTAGTFPALSGIYSFYGNATLVDYTTGVTWNTIGIVFSPSSESCPAPPPPPPCTGANSNGSNFNGTPIDGGNYIWFDAIFKANGIPSTGATVTFHNSTVSFSANGTNYNLTVHNAEVTFSPSVSCTSTTFDTMTNTWVTTVPIKGDDEIFLSGLAWPVPSGGLRGGINPVDWTGSFGVSPSTPSLQIQWQWGAAVYSSFTTNYNLLGIKAGHQTACGMTNGDHAGTPEGLNGSEVPWKNFVVGGARGGGGGNWTGSWSGTNHVSLECTP